MKRLLALMLTLTMVFALCACGSKELTDEEKEAIYQEVAEKKAAVQVSDNKNDAINTGPSGESEEAFFEFYEARLYPSYRTGYYYPDVKFKCLYSQKSEGKIPKFIIYFHFLDKDGTIVKQESIGIEDLNYGDIAWTCSFPSGRHTEMDFSLDEVATVEIVAYKVYNQDAENKKIHLKEPVAYSTAGLEIA